MKLNTENSLMQVLKKDWNLNIAENQTITSDGTTTRITDGCSWSRPSNSYLSYEKGSGWKTEQIGLFNRIFRRLGLSHQNTQLMTVTADLIRNKIRVAENMSVWEIVKSFFGVRNKELVVTHQMENFFMNKVLEPTLSKEVLETTKTKTGFSQKIKATYTQNTISTAGCVYLKSVLRGFQGY